MTFRDIPPLPTTNDYLEAVERVDAQFSEALGPSDALLNFMRTNLEVQHFTDASLRLSRIIDPLDIDGRVYVTDAYIASKASVMGSLAGLLLCYELKTPLKHPTVIFDSILVNTIATEDREEATKLITTEVNQFADEGIIHLGDEVISKTEPWEGRVVDELARQYMFRRAMALVVYSGYRIHEMSLFDIGGSTGVDWDEELKDLDLE